MKRALATMFLATTAMGLGGCATTDVQHHGGAMASRAEGRATVTVREADRRAAVTEHGEPTIPTAGPREGTPTPEPALPHGDTRFAGPTPQVPIPVVGSPMRGTW